MGRTSRPEYSRPAWRASLRLAQDLRDRGNTGPGPVFAKASPQQVSRPIERAPIPGNREGQGRNTMTPAPFTSQIGPPVCVQTIQVLSAIRRMFRLKCSCFTVFASNPAAVNGTRHSPIQ